MKNPRIRKATGLALLVLTLGGGTASAQFPIPNPFDEVLLVKILDAVRKMNAVLGDINETLAKTRTHLATIVWPRRSLDRIEAAFGEVEDIRSQVERLACGWRFSARARTLWDGLFRHVPFCKPEFERVFGPPPEYYARDIEEYLNAGAVLRLGRLAAEVEADRKDQENIDWLLEEAKKGRDVEDPTGPYGPGYSQRLGAIGAAMLAKQEHRNGQMELAHLQQVHDRANFAALRRRNQVDFALLTYALLAGRSPFMESTESAMPATPEGEEANGPVDESSAEADEPTGPVREVAEGRP